MLTDAQADGLREIINIGIGRAGSILSQLVGSQVTLSVPRIGACRSSEIGRHLGIDGDANLASVRQHFSGLLGGNAILVFPHESGSALARGLVGDDFEITDIDSERESALSEVGNIVLNNVLGSLSRMLNGHFEYMLPVYREGPIERLVKNEDPGKTTTDDDFSTIYANADFVIEEFKVTGLILLLFEVNSFGDLLAAVDKFVAESVPS